MSGSRIFNAIAWAITALALVLTILFMNGASLGIDIMDHTLGYEERLFDTSRVHTIDITMDDWDDLIANAASEEYYLADLVIDGEAYNNVGIRTKGNTSLSTVATLGSQRYSFKVEFDHYNSGETYYGLDKLSLNNLIQDATMMKDYLTYTMMNAFGVDSSLCSYVYITVNGEDWGLYLAVEGVEEAFLERNYGADYGELYKPDSLSFGGGRGNGGDFDMSDFDLDSLPESGAQSATDGDATAPEDSDAAADDSSGMPSPGGALPEGFDPSTMGEGAGAADLPDGFDPSTMGEGFDAADLPEDFDPSSMGEGEMPPTCRTMPAAALASALATRPTSNSSTSTTTSTATATSGTPPRPTSPPPTRPASSIPSKSSPPTKTSTPSSTSSRSSATSSFTTTSATTTATPA